MMLPQGNGRVHTAISTHVLHMENDLYTPLIGYIYYISIHVSHTEEYLYHSHREAAIFISIHILYTKNDGIQSLDGPTFPAFLPAPLSGEQLASLSRIILHHIISIHALRMEGDNNMPKQTSIHAIQPMLSPNPTGIGHSINLLKMVRWPYKRYRPPKKQVALPFSPAIRLSLHRQGEHSPIIEQIQGLSQHL